MPFANLAWVGERPASPTTSGTEAAVDATTGAPHAIASSTKANPSTRGVGERRPPSEIHDTIVTGGHEAYRAGNAEPRLWAAPNPAPVLPASTSSGLEAILARAQGKRSRDADVPPGADRRREERRGSTDGTGGRFCVRRKWRADAKGDHADAIGPQSVRGFDLAA